RRRAGGRRRRRPRRVPAAASARCSRSCGHRGRRPARRVDGEGPERGRPRTWGRVRALQEPPVLLRRRRRPDRPSRGRTRAGCAVDGGQIVNPDGVVNQIEGGIIQSTSWTLKESVGFDRTRVTTRSWADYPIVRFDEVPEVDVVLLDRPDERFLGVGEGAQG